MSTIKSLAFGVVLVAIVAPLCIHWAAEAQKTAANSFQQQFGSNQNSAYGGYQQQGQSPVGRPQQQSFSAARRPNNQQTSYSQSSSSSSSSFKQPAASGNRQPSYQQQEQASNSYESSDQAEADAEPASYGSVNGQPGQDFPAYTRVPKTSFSCDGLPYDYGMYADEETGCQAYHVCYNGRKDSFLCGVGTVFNQRILHCDYWYSVDCGKSSQYYGSNAYMGSSQPEPGPAEASGSNQQGGYSKRVEAASFNRPATYQQPQSSSKNQQVQQEESY